MIKEYFEFSKKEFNGLIILCSVLFLVLIAPYIYTIFLPVEKIDNSAFEKEVKAFLASATAPEDRYHKKSYNDYSKSTSKPVYFKFNPNNLPIESWSKLGLSQYQIKIIKNYENKGGKFFKKEDLKKIYSITETDYARLEPFIDIPAKSWDNKNSTNYPDNKTLYTKSKEVKILDINNADSAQLEALKGIGPAFAKRILSYRNRLGGFWRKEQLLEVYGLDSAKYIALQNSIALNPADIKTTNINTATFEELKRYPYLSYKQINAVLQYRKQHGSYSSTQDLKKVLILTDECIAKIAPYLTF